MIAAITNPYELFIFDVNTRQFLGGGTLIGPPVSYPSAITWLGSSQLAVGTSQGSVFTVDLTRSDERVSESSP